MKTLGLIFLAVFALSGCTSYQQAASTTAALPERDQAQAPQEEMAAPKYTGIIKNRTKYELAVPSANSGGTLTIPAQGWIEFISWSRNFDLTVYQDGKPFHCLKISAQPKNYPYMCQKYDFMAEIVKEEPAGRKYRPAGKKRLKMKRRLPGGVEALG